VGKGVQVQKGRWYKKTNMSVTIDTQLVDPDVKRDSSRVENVETVDHRYSVVGSATF
jgi:hypothetical protein